MPNMPIEQFRKAFVHVESVEISHSLLGEQWSDKFIECFPNVRHLDICDTELVRSDGARKSFEYLEHLTINGCSQLSTIQLATNLLHGARQLNHLELTSINEGDAMEQFTVLLDMIQEHPQITKLAYNFCREVITVLKRVQSEDVQRIVAEHAALVELRLNNHLFTVEGVLTLVRQLNSLTYFEFCIPYSGYEELRSQVDRNKWELNENFLFAFSLTRKVE